jgi:flavin-dependent dehydrogenase
VLGTARYTDDAGHLYAGEAAGVQDREWGFGMLHAMRSGALAATSLLDSGDYTTQAQHRFAPSQRAGFVNRMLFEATPEILPDRSCETTPVAPSCASD